MWGYWNGLDELLATRDQFYCRGVNLAQARQDGLIRPGEFDLLMHRAGKELAAGGFEDLNLIPSHAMLSVDMQGKLIRNDDGSLPLRFCNMSLLRRR